MSEIDFSQIFQSLAEPFPSESIQWKPGALSKDKTRALALAYVETREYIHRLNAIAEGNWSDDYEIHVLPDRIAVICRLTVFGVTRTGDGECLMGGSSETEPNAVTTASAQAFKRACVKFELGGYLYDLPQQWCDYDQVKRAIAAPPNLPDWALPVGERALAEALRPFAKTSAEALTELGYDPKPESPKAKPAPAAPAPEVQTAPDDTSAEEALPNPGSIIVHFGRYKGKSLEDIWAMGKEGQGWIKWAANTEGKGFTPKGDKDVALQRMARAFLMLNVAYSG